MLRALFELAGFAPVMHGLLCLVKQLFGDSRLMGSLVSLTSEVETAVVEGVFEHTLHLGRGEDTTLIIGQSKLVNFDTNVLDGDTTFGIKFKHGLDMVEVNRVGDNHTGFGMVNIATFSPTGIDTTLKLGLDTTLDVF